MPRNTYTRRRPYRPSSYNYTSEAYEYFPGQQYPNYGREMGEKDLYRKKIPKADIYTLKGEKAPALSKISILFVIVFSFAMVCLVTQINISAKQNNITVLRNQLAEIEENNNHLETELNKSIDLAKIKTTATTKLGMQAPTKYQTVYINVPKDSSTVQYDNEKTKKENTGESILSQISQ